MFLCAAGTWGWTGTNWTNLAPTIRPGGRAYATMLPAQSGAQVVMFGGVGQPVNRFGDRPQTADSCTFDTGKR